MARVIVVANICFLATVCFAQEKYSNSKWHFSFTVPEGWEVITKDTLLSNYAEELEIRFKDVEILAMCREVGAEDEKSSMLVQARNVGEAKEGLSLETVFEDWLRSNAQWEMSNSYLKDFRIDLMRRGDIAKEVEYERQIYYDADRHIFFETVALPLKRGEAIGISTVRLLGSNKVTILSFNLYGRGVEDLLGLVKEVVDSFTYDEHYGFGEATSTDIAKTLWHWLFPGLGTIIVAFLLYKWVASEYG